VVADTHQILKKRGQTWNCGSLFTTKHNEGMNSRFNVMIKEK